MKCMIIDFTVTYRSCKVTNDKVEILILHSLKTGLLHKCFSHLLDQRQVGRLWKLAFLVNYRVHTQRL